MKWLLVLLAIVIVGGGVAVFSAILKPAGQNEAINVDDQMIIGFLMASNSSSIERWSKDRAFFIERAEALGAKVVVYDAGIDADLQAQQAENLILQGVDVLVIVPQDAELSAEIVEKAHQAGIKVIAYDRLVKHEALDYYVSFDNVKVGESQAQGVLDVISEGRFAYVGGSEKDANAFLVKEGSMNILQPLISSGQIEIVFDSFTEDWKQDVAYTNMKRFLQQGGSVDAVVAANDSTAAGVIRALEEVGLAGKVPVSGQDASLAAVQFVANGKQTVTVYKPIKSLAYKSAEIAVAIMKGESVVTNNTIENVGVRTPAYLLDVVSVTKDTIEETVIKDQFLTREEIYGQ
jgi:D-xylose transport system substrate-binding protein